MKRRPRLLFLACRFPPLQAIGCVRSWSLAKYLTRLGWHVTVVTPHPSLWRRTENDKDVAAALKQEGVDQILTGHRWRCLSPVYLNCSTRGVGRLAGGFCRKVARYFDVDPGVGWVAEAERACESLRPEEVDVILATAGPFAAFRLAKRLSDRLGRPYVLDYRDPWTGNPHAMRAASPRRQREERSLLASSSAVTIVSGSWRSALDSRFAPGAKLHVVTNGYDPEDLAKVESHRFGHFAIVYTGRFYPPKRVATPLMPVLQRLKLGKPKPPMEWRFHYYGDEGEHVREAAERWNVSEHTVIHGSVSRSEALSAVRGAGIAVVITTVADQSTGEERGIVPAKLFEALGLGTPVLVIAPPGSDVEGIIETSGRARRYAGSDTAGMTEFVINAMSGLTPGSKQRQSYAWPNLAERMNMVLCRALGTSEENRLDA